MQQRPLITKLNLLKRAKRFAHESLGKNVVFEAKLANMCEEFSGFLKTAQTDKERAICVLLVDGLEQLRSAYERERAPLLKIASIGGHARAEALSPKARTQIARKAAKARWSK